MFYQNLCLYMFASFVPGSCLSSILVVEPSKTRSFPIKTRVIWAPGMNSVWMPKKLCEHPFLPFFCCCFNSPLGECNWLGLNPWKLARLSSLENRFSARLSPKNHSQINTSLLTIGSRIVKVNKACQDDNAHWLLGKLELSGIMMRNYIQNIWKQYHLEICIYSMI